MTTPPAHRLTAEWKCGKCGVTNRKLAAPGTGAILDRCVTCGTPHDVRPGARPPFWHATPRQ